MLRRSSSSPCDSAVYDSGFRGLGFRITDLPRSSSSPCDSAVCDSGFRGSGFRITDLRGSSSSPCDSAVYDFYGFGCNEVEVWGLARL